MTAQLISTVRCTPGKPNCFSAPELYPLYPPHLLYRPSMNGEFTYVSRPRSPRRAQRRDKFKIQETSVEWIDERFRDTQTRFQQSALRQRYISTEPPPLILGWLTGRVNSWVWRGREKGVCGSPGEVCVSRTWGFCWKTPFSPQNLGSATSAFSWTECDV